LDVVFRLYLDNYLEHAAYCFQMFNDNIMLVAVVVVESSC